VEEEWTMRIFPIAAGFLMGVSLLCGCSGTPRFTSSKQPVGSAPATRYGENEWVGIASYYGKKFHGRKTASGEVFDMYGMTAAHLTLPLGSVVEVTNLENNRKIVVRVNDRGPYVKNRIIDLSYGAAEKLDMIGPGTVKVRIRVIARAEKK
jgi:rare lipoprotein A